MGSCWLQIREGGRGGGRGREGGRKGGREGEGGREGKGGEISHTFSMLLQTLKRSEAPE